MRSFGFQHTEEHPEPAISRRLETDAVQPEAGYKLEPAGIPVHRTVLNGLKKIGRHLARRSVLQLQQCCGNQCVLRAVELAGKADSKAEVAPDLERTIETARGTGHSLDSTTCKQLGSALNAEFSSVRVHTDTTADSLNRSLNARAFTTGQDIFFRQGEYNPGSSSGRELLAHELTHVVQQMGGKIRAKNEDEATTSSYYARKSGLDQCIQAKLTVSSPGDVHEEEADRVAQAYTKLEQGGTRPISFS